MIVGDETNFPYKLLLTDRQVAKRLRIIYQQILSYQKLNNPPDNIRRIPW